MTIHIQYQPLHPTFAAEATVIGGDLRDPTPELAELIKQGMAKVSACLCDMAERDDPGI